MGRHGLRNLRNGWIGTGRSNDRSGADERFGGGCLRDSLCGQRAIEFLLDCVRRVVVFGRGRGADASRIPSSQSSVPFLMGSDLTATNPAIFSHLAVSETE